MPRWGGGGQGYVTNPSGISIPAVANGQTRLMVDDFPGTVLNSSIWSTPYNGTSYASQNGWYATNHTVVTPSVLNLQGYTDAAGGGIANGFVGACRPQLATRSVCSSRQPFEWTWCRATASRRSR